MVKRGTQLTEHILWAAKDVFLEMGFERASMDEVARRAETSKRTLYAHFQSKENLFVAVLTLVRALLQSRVRVPGYYSSKPEEALTLFCSRYLETLLYESSIRMCRLTMAETERFPEAAASHFAALFTEVEERIAGYVGASFGAPARTSREFAERLFGQLLYPLFLNALFGLRPLARDLEPDAATPGFELMLVRKAVADMIAALPKPARR